jgi:hypothetical protein
MLFENCFMIVVEDSEASNYYASYCIPSWEKAGLKVKKFPAITPKTLVKQKELRFTKYSHARKYLNLNLKAEITDTEKAVWYSHFKLWQECCFLNQEILIMEHDSFLEHPEKLWKNDNYGIIFYDKAAMGSYAIKPWFAKKLVEVSMDTEITAGPYSFIHGFALHEKIVDKVVNSSHKKYVPCSNQVMSSKYGNTVEHYCNIHPEHWSQDKFHKFIEI